MRTEKRIVFTFFFFYGHGKEKVLSEIGPLITLGYHTARCYRYVSASPTSGATGVDMKLPGPVYYSVVQTISNRQVEHFQIYLKKKGS